LKKVSVDFAADFVHRKRTKTGTYIEVHEERRNRL
jgi:hypothetical protein